MEKEFEALKIVDDILNNFGGDKVQIETMTLSKCNILTIKNYILKAQELEKENAEYKKVLRIILEKHVHIPQLLCAFENQLEEENPLEVYYNGQVGINVPMPLTQEEFDLLKQYFEKNIQKARLR